MRERRGIPPLTPAVPAGLLQGILYSTYSAEPPVVMRMYLYMYIPHPPMFFMSNFVLNLIFNSDYTGAALDKKIRSCKKYAAPFVCKLNQ